MDEHLTACQRYFDHFSESVEYWQRRNFGYHGALASLIRFYVPEGARVLEIGSGSGNLLAAAKPSRGLGMDISGEMVRLAAARHPHLEFRQVAAERLESTGEQFDYIILSDLVSFLYDIRLAFERLRPFCHPQTRIVMHWYSRLWQPVLSLAEALGLKYPQPLLNWTTPEDIANFLYLADYEPVVRQKHLLIPTRIPLVSRFANRFLAHLPGIRQLCLTNWIVARTAPVPAACSARTVSIVCPCRNEAGNIQQIARRMPFLGSHTELIFVEGNSTDATWEECRIAEASAGGRDIKALRQTGKGKGDAVRLGFSQATGDILMILDADISVVPEDLASFYETLVSGKGEFINGSRLVYTKDPDAMRFLNLVANRFFALLLSRLLGQPVKDTLCGTKVMWRRQYEQLARGRSYFGEFDLYGDFDMLFGAAKLNLKIIEVPVRYRQRTYGSTNISRVSGGILLLRMSLKASSKLFFIS